MFVIRQIGYKIMNQNTITLKAETFKVCLSYDAAYLSASCGSQNKTV